MLPLSESPLPKGDFEMVFTKVTSNWLATSLALASSLLLYSELSRAEGWGERQKLAEFTSRENVRLNHAELEALGLRSSEIPNRPWSDTFWPDFKGSIAVPYAQINFTNFPLNWAINRNTHFSSRINYLRADLLGGGPSRAGLSDLDIADLAPSEKYDLLLGDLDFTLTRQIIAMIDERNAHDATANWSGICHGWSPASLNVPRPVESFVLEVTIPALGKIDNRVRIKFYPSDVKALASYLWGKSNVQNYVKVEGWQCNTQRPATSENGRILDPHCFDVNPGFFHLVLLNQIGLNHRGLVIDRDFRRPVRNQPVFGYQYSTFRVDGLRPISNDLRDQLVSISRDSSRPSSYFDPYSDFRSPRARYLLGVQTTVQYAKETSPNHRDTDDPSRDDSDTRSFTYDLELDENLEIVGGEWLQQSHPDVLWLTPPDSITGEIRAYSVGDYDASGRLAFEVWTGNGPIPRNWPEAARRAANYRNDSPELKTHLQPQPLAQVVESLVRFSRRHVR